MSTKNGVAKDTCGTLRRLLQSPPALVPRCGGVYTPYWSPDVEALSLCTPLTWSPDVEVLFTLYWYLHGEVHVTLYWSPDVEVLVTLYWSPDV